MTACTPMPGNVLGTELADDARVSPEEYEALALEMLDVAVSDINKMKATMWRILASAPVGTDAPRLLRLAIERLAARAAEDVPAPLPAVRNEGCRAVAHRVRRGHGVWRVCPDRRPPSRSQSRRHDA